MTAIPIIALGIGAVLLIVGLSSRGPDRPRRKDRSGDSDSWSSDSDCDGGDGGGD